MAISNWLVSGVTSAAPVKICTLGESGGLVTGSISGMFVGGPSVATSGANVGIPLPVTPTLLFVPGVRTTPSQAVPSGADQTCDLYAIVVSGSGSVTFFAPQGG